MSEVQRTQPPLPEGFSVRPSQLVLIEAAEVLSLWQRLAVDDEHLAPKNAWKLVALWAHLCRFPEGTVNTPTKATLDREVEKGKKRLVTQMLRYAAEGWLAQANDLNSAWDWVHAEPDLHDFGRQAWQLFNDLDRFSLAAYSADRWLREDPRLLADDESSRTALEDLKRYVKEGEDYVREHADVFLPAASLASLYLLAYRPNLDEEDEDLWLTTLKHRVLEESLEEANEPSPRARLGESDLASLRAIVRKLVIGQSGSQVTPATETFAPGHSSFSGGPTVFVPVFRKLLEEYRAREANYATAAARPDETLTDARADLAGHTFSVEGDENTQVMLDLRLPSGEVWVRLAQPSASIGAYVRFDLTIPGLAALVTGDLAGAAGKATLTRAQFDALSAQRGMICVNLITREGVRRNVRLEEDAATDLEAGSQRIATPLPERVIHIAATLPGAGEKISRQEREPVFSMAAESAPPEVASRDRGAESPPVSIYKLRDQRGSIVELRTDRDGRVFAVLPEDISLAAPKSVLINNQTYLLTPSQPLLIEIVDLRKGDLRELADSDFIVKGTWQ